MNSNPGIVSSGLPVTVTGTVTANLGTIDGAATEATLNGISTAITSGVGLAGTGANGQTVCTSANTWYALPSGTPPTAPYELVANSETTAGTVRVAFSNSGTPSSTNGVIWPKNVLLAVVLGASNALYVSSSNAGDTINWSTKKVA